MGMRQRGRTVSGAQGAGRPGALVRVSMAALLVREGQFEYATWLQGPCPDHSTLQLETPGRWGPEQSALSGPEHLDANQDDGEYHREHSDGGVDVENNEQPHRDPLQKVAEEAQEEGSCQQREAEWFGEEQ